MTWLIAIVKLIAMFFSFWMTRKAEKKARKKECLEKMREGFKKKDLQKITDAFARANR